MTVYMSTTGRFGLATANAGDAGDFPTFAASPSMPYAISMKSPAHMINNVVARLNGVQLTRATDY
jgi:hypothetical protein